MLLPPKVAQLALGELEGLAPGAFDPAACPHLLGGCLR